jgi:energy-coupling factor transporter transmembrane protein EcfT
MPEQPTHQDREDDLPYTTSMRIFGGVTWGTITTLGIAVILILVPQVPRPWLWSTIPIWLGLISLGVFLQWSIARGPCPKCGYRLVVPPMGKRCPQCRSYLKAVDRTITRVT